MLQGSSLLMVLLDKTLYMRSIYRTCQSVSVGVLRRRMRQLPETRA